MSAVGKSVFENSRQSEFCGGAGPLPLQATHQDIVWVAGRGSGPAPRNARSAHFQTTSRGFTLIEMLVVIAITALIAGLAFPSIERTLVRQEFEGAARTIDLGLHQARADAIRRGRPVRLGIGADRRSFGGDTAVLVAIPAAVTLTLPAQGIIFYADGSSTGGDALLIGNGRQRGRQQRTTIDPQTGVIGRIT